MPEPEQTPQQRFKETLRKSAELMEQVPEWVRRATSIDGVFGGREPDPAVDEPGQGGGQTACADNSSRPEAR